MIALGCGESGTKPISDASPQTLADAVTPTNWTFVSQTEADFDRGDYGAGSQLLSWNTNQVRFGAGVEKGDTGVYVSPVFDTGSDEQAIWETLSWIPISPYNKPLTDSAGSELGYLEGAVDMANNILLLHLDEISLSHNAPLLDGSGLRHDGRVVLDGHGITQTAGVFGGGLDIARDAWVSMEGASFDFGIGDFTYSIWVKMRPCSESNDNRIAMGGEGSNDGPHLWLGASCPTMCDGLDGAHLTFLDSTFDGPTLNVCTGVRLGDGEWHHLAGVKQGHAPATVRLLVDGNEVAAMIWDFGNRELTYNSGEIRLGGFNRSGSLYNTTVMVDEAAIWKRALSNSEIAAVHQRARVHLRLQVRVCDTATCFGVPFVGPDGTTNTYFTEVDLTGPAGSQANNLAPLNLVGARAQYRVYFSTELATISPGLRQVSITARRE